MDMSLSTNHYYADISPVREREREGEPFGHDGENLHLPYEQYVLHTLESVSCEHASDVLSRPPDELDQVGESLMQIDCVICFP